MESSTKTTLKIGVFLFTGILFILLSILMIGADKSFLAGNIKLFSRFDSVQGLNIGSVVSISGISIGNVEKIDYDVKENNVVVEFKIQKKFSNLLRTGMRADIRTQGALGDKYIYLIPSADPNASLLTSGTYIESEKSADILGIIAKRGNDTEQFFDIINEVHALMKSINDEHQVPRILSNMTHASENFNLASSEIKKMLENNKFKASVDKLDNILNKIDKGEGTLGALINDSSLHSQLKTMLGSSDRKEGIKSLMRTSIERSK